MSEIGASSAIDQPDGKSTSEGLTAGSIMRRAREAAGISVEILAVSLKIPAKKLEALESDGLHTIHDAVFVRALASGVCRHLKLDPAPVLAKLPQNETPRISKDERGINQPFRASGDSSGGGFMRLVTTPQTLFVAVLVAGIAAMLWLPEHATFDLGASTNSKATKEAERVLPVSPPLVGESVPVGAPSTRVSEPLADMVPTGSQGIRTAASMPTPALVASAPPLAAAVTSEGGIPIVTAPHLLVFKAKATSWIQVLDVKGVVLVSKAISAGDVLETNGTTPLSVVVGRADAVVVEVRGNVFNLDSVARENVARFEVK